MKLVDIEAKMKIYVEDGSNELRVIDLHNIFQGSSIATGLNKFDGGSIFMVHYSDNKGGIYEIRSEIKITKLNEV